MAEGRLIVLGAGGHGSVVLDALLSTGAHVEGILDPAQAVGHQVFGISILGGDEWLAAGAPADLLLVNGVGATPRNWLRSRLFTEWKLKGFRFATVVHPSAVLGRATSLSEGVQVMAGAVIQCRVSVAENVVINTRASLDHDTAIGAHAFIGPGATLCGDTSIGPHVFIGAGAVILPGVTIEAGAIIGAGAVVTRHVPAGAVVLGNPAVQRKSDRA